MDSIGEDRYSTLLRIYNTPGRGNHSAWLWSPASILSCFTHPVHKCSSQIATPHPCAQNRKSWPQYIKIQPCSQSHGRALFVVIAADGASAWAAPYQESVKTEPGTCKPFPNEDIEGEMYELSRTRWVSLILWLTGCSYYYCFLMDWLYCMIFTAVVFQGSKTAFEAAIV